ncbi:hypothetical protein BN159_4286 [Streptomyces davaonensis JCM 4913]|uniref:Uncharacterized protein n=1 Tax=Streptomyces davaonensis (strain DSM 101723 / JCM 4913 / KCC S-0913 / 768) TaxID=1214101 RepID=K4R6E9_STRDJ|nr:hypothetical protein BN159_4286 [Streptomyces davaonensis JCM 4913]
MAYRLTPFSGNHENDCHKKQRNRFHCGLPHKVVPTRGGGCREPALLPSRAILPQVEARVRRFGKFAGPSLHSEACARALPHKPVHAFTVGGNHATVPRAVADRAGARGRRHGEVWRTHPDRRSVSEAGCVGHLPLPSASGSVVGIRCGSAQGEGGPGEEAQEALAQADINAAGRQHTCMRHRGLPSRRALGQDGALIELLKRMSRLQVRQGTAPTGPAPLRVLGPGASCASHGKAS